MSSIPQQQFKSVPHLMQLLQVKFEEADGPIDEACAADFVAFAQDYLDKNRPVNLSNQVDQNYQVFLSNQETFVIAPARDSGLLPSSGAISCNRNS